MHASGVAGYSGDNTNGGVRQRPQAVGGLRGGLDAPQSDMTSVRPGEQGIDM